MRTLPDRIKNLSSEQLWTYCLDHDVDFVTKVPSSLGTFGVTRSAQLIDIWLARGAEIYIRLAWPGLEQIENKLDIITHKYADNTASTQAIFNTPTVLSLTECSIEGIEGHSLPTLFGPDIRQWPLFMIRFYFGRRVRGWAKTVLLQKKNDMTTGDFWHSNKVKKKLLEDFSWLGRFTYKGKYFPEGNAMFTKTFTMNK